MILKTLTVGIENGLEARPLAMLVQIASRYESSIYFERDGRRVNGKSIMGIMTLGLDYEDSVTVSADGADEEEAIQQIEAYLLGE